MEQMTYERIEHNLYVMSRFSSSFVWDERWARASVAICRSEDAEYARPTREQVAEQGRAGQAMLCRLVYLMLCRLRLNAIIQDSAGQHCTARRAV
jgi:hypothetical protein